MQISQDDLDECEKRKMLLWLVEDNRSVDRVRSNREVHGRSYDLRHNLLERVSIIAIKNTNRMKTY
jgi:hypothetical protein